MSYHIDLWATAVFYAVLWGVKIFVVAPPTPRNMRFMQSWQRKNEDEKDTRFPKDLELAKIVVLTAGQVRPALDPARGLPLGSRRVHAPTRHSRCCCPRGGSTPSSRPKTLAYSAGTGSHGSRCAASS